MRPSGGIAQHRCGRRHCRLDRQSELWQIDPLQRPDWWQCPGGQLARCHCRSGRWSLDGREVELIDLPGTYALDSSPSASQDEIIARDFAATGGADVIINVLDATAIERGLYLTFQLLEMRVPLVVAVNRMDLARREGIRIDLD